MRSGPAFQLKTRLDDSEIQADGTLVRSDRMARLEAALLISGAAVSARRLAQTARLIDAKEVVEMIELLNSSYDRTRSAFRIERTATGYQLMTRPLLAGWLDRLHQRQSQMKLSQPAMETLTIIAYRQPTTRADVEAVRGVQSTDMIRQLIDRGLVRVGGEDDSLGRPFLYQTTRKFLDMFGLRSIQDMPDYDTLGRTVVDEEASDEALEGYDDADGSQTEASAQTSEADDLQTTDSSPAEQQDQEAA
jgi:segregation and condensation protein B